MRVSLRWVRIASWLHFQRKIRSKNTRLWPLTYKILFLWTKWMRRTHRFSWKLKDSILSRFCQRLIFCLNIVMAIIPCLILFNLRCLQLNWEQNSWFIINLTQCIWRSKRRFRGECNKNLENIREDGWILVLRGSRGVFFRNRWRRYHR
jgi:hypothetical protein